MSRSVEQMIGTYQRLGWCPVPYAHQPKEIRDALRRIGMRPQIKHCYANSQRFIWNVDWLDLVYHEGLVVAPIPLAHAWLTWEGQRIDLTLNIIERDIKVLSDIPYSAEDVSEAIVMRQQYAPIDLAKMWLPEHKVTEPAATLPP